MRGDAVAERFEHVPELLLRFCARQPQHVEHLALDVGAVDPDAPAPELVPVEHDVVGAGLGPCRIQVLRGRHGEGVVLGNPFTFVLAPFEHGEVGDPGEVPPPLRDQAESLGQEPAKAVQGDAHAGRTVRHDDHQVAVSRARRFPNGQHLVRRKVLLDGRARRAPFERDPHEAGRPSSLRLLDQAVEVPSGPSGGARCGKPPDLPPVGDDLREGAEAAPGEHLGEVGQLQPVPRVGVVGAEPGHGLLVGDARPRRADLNPQDLAPQPGEHRLQDRVHVLLAHERHLQVELGELPVPVRPEVLVAHASSDLVVAVEAGHHQQLFELLR